MRCTKIIFEHEKTSQFVLMHIFILMILLRNPTAVQPMTGIEVFKYQASDG